jgi:hypothetical protein
MRYRFGAAVLWIAVPWISMLGACSNPERAGVEEVFNFTPLAYYEKSADPPGYSVDVLWPLINVYRAGEANGHRAFPLYSWDRKAQDASDLRLLLLYGASETAERNHHELIPLFWHTTSKTNPDWSATKILLALIGATYDKDLADRWFFPFYFDEDSPTRNTFALWPFYGFRTSKDADDVVSRLDHVAWPLFRFESTSDDSASSAHLVSFEFLAGLYSRERQTPISDRDTRNEFVRTSAAGWVLGGLFSLFESSATERWGGTRVASLFNGRTLLRGGDHLETDKSSDLTSLYASSWRNDEAGEATRRHSHLFPLYSSTTSAADGDDLWLLTPLYRHRANPTLDASSHDLLGGLWSYGSSGSGETRSKHWRLLPLLWFTTRPDTKTHLVLPLYYHLADAENDYLHFIPFYGKNTEANGKATKTFVLTPLYIGTRDERNDLTRTDLLFPLISWESSIEGSSSRFSPFWYYETHAARSHWNFLLFADGTRSEVESSTLVYPLYAERLVRGEGRLQSYLPLLDVVRYLEGSVPSGDETTVLYPLSSFRTQGETYRRHVFPFYWWRDNGLGQSLKAIWPFYGISRNSDFAMHSVVWPFFRFGSDTSGNRSELHLFSPLFAQTHRRGEGSETHHSRFFPLYWWCNGDAEGGSWSSGWVLWPLWRYQAKQSGEICAHSLFKLGEYERSPDGQVEQLSILHALYRYRREGQHETRSVPFLYRYESEGDRATLHLFHFIPIEL